jgi:MFS family permease
MHEARSCDKGEILLCRRRTQSARMGSFRTRQGSAVPTDSWVRLLALITRSTLGCVGLWSLAVALWAVHADFDMQRGGDSVPHDRLHDRRYHGRPVCGPLRHPTAFAGGTILMCLGYILSASAPTLLAFALVSGLTIGLRSAASLPPLMADAPLWFDRHRGLAISLATIGSSLSCVISRLVTGRSAHAPAKRAGAQ